MIQEIISVKIEREREREVNGKYVKIYINLITLMTCFLGIKTSVSIKFISNNIAGELTGLYALLDLIGHVLKGLSRHLCPEVPVKRGRHAPLLHVTQDILTTGKHTFPLLREQMLYEISCVVGIGIFVPKHLENRILLNVY